MKAWRRVGLLMNGAGWAFFATICINISAADVVVISLGTNSTREVFLDLPATFGHAIPDEGILGRFRFVFPEDGCESVDPPPPNDVFFNPTHTWIAVVRKGGCEYKQKISNAMRSNYSAVIIYNVGSNRLELMRCKGAGCSGLIPSMFVGADDGLMLSHFDPELNLLFLTEDLPFDLNKYLLPFAVVVGVCFLILLLFMIYKCIRDSRRARRHRMPWRSLKKIPQIKFKKGDPYEICAICLDEYAEGEKLRVLYCSHAFHCKCIDPWLTKSRRVCPICKRKVFANNERRRADTSSSDDDDDGAASRRSAPSTRRNTNETDEAAPLLSGRATAMGAVAAAIPPGDSSRPPRRSRLRAFRLFGRRIGLPSAGSDDSEGRRASGVADYGAVGTGNAEPNSSNDFVSDHSINGDGAEYPHYQQPGGGQRRDGHQIV